jgi:hypothetical protein
MRTFALISIFAQLLIAVLFVLHELGYLHIR